MARDNFVDYNNMQDILNGIEQKISGLGSQLTGIYNWATNTQYRIGDVVIENGSLFICKTVHTSSTSFASDIANWILFYADISPWMPNTYYVANACVINDKKLYQCKTAHTSGTTFSNTDWNLIAGGGGSSISVWTTSKQYNADDIVIYSNSLYRCNTTHTSSTFSTDVSNWDLVYADLKNWNNNVYYSSGVTVIYNSKIYVCNTAHTSASTFSATEKANWTPLCTTSIKNWQASIYYDVDDIVIYNGSLFRCTIANTSSTFNASNFSLITSDLKSWSASTSYVVGSTVINDKKLYRCKTAHTSGTTFADTNWDLIGGSSIDDWQASTVYNVGDLVIESNVLYQCNTAHTSGSTFSDTNWDKIDGGFIIQPYEDTPIGTIISYMGTTAPDDYLVCDGAVYNISDYWELADFINAQFGSKNYFGGDGTTTFAVPDLRGEFLRGSGTNSHASQGSGSTVGTHQDATNEMAAMVYSDNNMYIKKRSSDNSAITAYENVDSYIQTPVTNPRSIAYTPSNVYNDSSKQNVYYTARPTNTSVLYCIKYTNAPSMQPSNVYSTVEKRIGTWIDGKPLYQKTYSGVSLPSTADTYMPVIDMTSLNIESLIGFEGIVTPSSTHIIGNDVAFSVSGVNINSNSGAVTIYYKGSDKKLYCATPSIYVGRYLCLTLKYTKT